MVEQKQKRNPDYTSSAVNLCNPPEIERLLIDCHSTQTQIDDLDATLKVYPEYEQMVELQQKLAGHRKAIEQAIEEYGSYQEIELGWYGLKQKAVTIKYEVGDFENAYPEYARAVIIKAIDAKKLDGLIKGGLLFMENLEAIGVIKKSESYRFIIR